MARWHPRSWTWRGWRPTPGSASSRPSPATSPASPRSGFDAPAPTLDALAPGRLRRSVEGWFEEPFPASRDAWREILAEHDRKGSAGVIVAMDARLLDLLRNPDQEDDRSADLQLAQG